MPFLRYSKFLFSSLVRKWSIYITSGLFLLAMIMFIYVYPLVIHKTLSEILNLRGILMCNMILGSIAAATLAVQIYRNGIEDGSDLLILSKPITRQTVLNVKLFVFFISVLCISLTAMFCGIWTLFLPAATNELARSIIAGYFTGTFVNFILWGSVAILCSVFFKRFIALTVTIFIYILLGVASVVYWIVETPTGTGVVKEGYRLNPICLISQPNKEGLTKYHWVAIPSINNTVVTEDTKLENGTPKELGINLKYFTYNLWQKAEKQTNQSVLSKIDFNLQLNSLYSLIGSKQLTHGTGIAINFYNLASGWGPESSNFTLSLQKEGGIKNSVSPYLTPLGFSISKLNPKVNLNKNFVVSTNDYLMFLFYKYWDKAVNDSYKSTNMLNSDCLRINYENTKNTGWFKTNLNTNNFTLPIFTLNQKNKDWETKTFNNPYEFISYFYNSQLVNDNKNFITNLVKNEHLNKLLVSGNRVNFATSYCSLIATYLLKKFNFNINHFNKQAAQEFLTTYKKMMMKFQYWTFLGYQDLIKNLHPKENEFNQNSYSAMIMMLNLPEHYYKVHWLNSIFKTSALFITPQQFATLFNDLKNDNLLEATLLNPNLQAKINNLILETNGDWAATQIPLSLLPTSYLAAATNFQIHTLYNLPALIVCWLIFSLVLLFVSTSFYRKKDII